MRSWLGQSIFVLVAWAGVALAQGEPARFDGVPWIWYAPRGGAADQGEGVWYFRSALQLPETSRLKLAEMWLTADNLYTIYINGRFGGESSAQPDDWRVPRRFDVTSLLVPGRNVVAIEAANTAPGPAGLLVKLIATLEDGQQLVLNTDNTWRAAAKGDANWQQPMYDDNAWATAVVVAPYGAAPWGRFAPNLPGVPLTKIPAGPSVIEKWRKGGGPVVRISNQVVEEKPGEDFAWPGAVVYVGDDCSLYHSRRGTGTSWDSLGVTIFTARKSRAYPEHDLPAPIKMGRKLYLLAPARPGVKPRVLFDAGKGALGSPTASWDGKSVYFALAPEGDAFFHIYRQSLDGGAPVQLTRGPFHDIDPCELPDGRLVFTSTRIGTFEEYHCPPSRALFAMRPDGSRIRPLTNTLIFDNEPEVLADGRIVFIRSDNFFDRGKVETLLHAVHPDGTDGYTEFGLDNGPEYGGRLRAFYCGSPAPLPDGRLAFVSAPGITIGRPGSPLRELTHLRVDAGDVAALPDNRLLCTIPRMVPFEIQVGNDKRVQHELTYDKISILDVSGQPKLFTLLDNEGQALHSPIFVGARPKPPLLAERVDPRTDDEVGHTGYLYCANVRFTRNKTAGWSHVRAVRVLAGKGLTIRSSHAYIVHAGSEVTELGTVPLAPDGSVSLEVPADTPIAFQAVDAEGRSELNEMSWIYVRPGERRACLGCHQPRQATPPHRAGQGLGQALSVPPVRLVGQGRPHRFRGNNAAVTGLMEMQFDRYREVASLNRHADTGEPLATGQEEMAAQIAALGGKDPDLRVSAAQRLAIFRAAAAAPALARRLADSNREVRLAAAVALATCGTRESVTTLLAALGDDDPVVAQAAAMALENLTGHAEPFNPFGAERATQAAAWQAWFRANGWEAIEKDLVARLGHESRDVARRAAVALGHTGGEAARAALRDYVDRERKSNPYPEWRKRNNGDGARFNSRSVANPRSLQAAVRALGYLRDNAAVPLLRETLVAHSDPSNGNLFLAEAVTEALGRIATPEAEQAVIAGLGGLRDYFYYVGWYGDHSALYACHASPTHYFAAEALDWMGSRQATAVIPHLIRSVPTDPDRALFFPNDDCETLVGRVIRRQGAEETVVETCLSLLGDAAAKPSKDIAAAVGKTYGAWAGHPDAQNRAAHILSLTCRDRRFEPRIRAALERYRARDNDGLQRAFGGGGLPRKLPAKHWVCFFLARALGNLADPASYDALVAVLEQCPPEAAGGCPDAASPAVLFLHNDLTPCFRAAAAWALGRLGDARAVPVLLKVVENLANAPDTRYAAADALGKLVRSEHLAALQKLAAEYPEVSTRRALLRACASLGG